MDAQHQLLYAVQIGDVELTAQLLANGVNINAQLFKVFGCPLHQAAYEGHFDVVKTLLIHGANINQHDKDLRTPLHIAGFQGHPDIVRLLLQKGADEWAVDKQGNTWVHLATRYSRWQVLDLLLEDRAAGMDDCCNSCASTATAVMAAGPWSHLPQAKAIATHLMKGVAAEGGSHTAIQGADIPAGWSPAEAESLNGKLHVDGTTVEHVYPHPPDDDLEDLDRVVAIRSTSPAPERCMLYFYEVEVTSNGLAHEKDPPVSIGLAASTMTGLSHVGWEDHAYGYHGDDGRRFHAWGHGWEYGPQYQSGDVIGVLWNRPARTIRFFKNGIDLGVAFREVDEAVLYPAVGFSKLGCKVDVNCGDRPWKTQAAAPPLLHALQHRRRDLLLLLLSALPTALCAAYKDMSLAGALLCLDWVHVLHAAAKADNVALMQLALQQHIPVHSWRQNEESTLMAAAKAGAVAAVHLLLHQGGLQLLQHDEKDVIFSIVESALLGHHSIIRLFMQKAWVDPWHASKLKSTQLMEWYQQVLVSASNEVLHNLKDHSWAAGSPWYSARELLLQEAEICYAASQMSESADAIESLFVMLGAGPESSEGSPSTAQAEGADIYAEPPQPPGCWCLISPCCKGGWRLFRRWRRRM